MVLVDSRGGIAGRPMKTGAGILQTPFLIEISVHRNTATFFMNLTEAPKYGNCISPILGFLRNIVYY